MTPTATVWPDQTSFLSADFERVSSRLTAAGYVLDKSGVWNGPDANRAKIRAARPRPYRWYFVVSDTTGPTGYDLMDGGPPCEHPECERLACLHTDDSYTTDVQIVGCTTAEFDRLVGLRKSR